MIQANRKLVVCLVTGAYPKYLVGGSEVQLYYIGRELVKRGYEVHYTTCDYGQDAADTTIDEGITIHKIRYRVPFFGFIRALWRSLRDADADVYLNRALGYTLITWIFVKLHGRRFIYSVASSTDCVPRKVFPVSPRGVRGAIRDRVNQIGMCAADEIMVQADYQKELLKRNFHVDSTTVRNIHPMPSVVAEKQHPPMVLWLASLKRLKQAELFIELAKRCGELDCKFILAGQASDERYRKELTGLMQGTENIEYVGAVTMGESDVLIGRASVFVNTSRYEGFPNTFVQAWMHGVPVVSLNVDPDEILRREGLGFHSVSFEQMVKDVKRLIVDTALRRSMGDRAREYARRHHSMDPNVAKVVSLVAHVP